jgi:hypothetical protein
VFSQVKSVEGLKSSKGEPIMFLDGIRTHDLNSINPKDLAAVRVYKDTSAIKIIGEEGKNGLIYIFTKVYAREKYFNFFQSISDEYRKKVPTLKEENDIIYILNNKILKDDYIGELFWILDKDSIEMNIIEANTLAKDYKISGKKWGIKITTK